MGFQPMQHRQDADATGLHGQHARATISMPSSHFPVALSSTGRTFAECHS